MSEITEVTVRLLKIESGILKDLAQIEMSYTEGGKGSKKKVKCLPRYMQVGEKHTICFGGAK